MHIKLLKKVKFSPKDNRMKKVGNVKNAIKHFKNNLNLRFLLRNRFRWMNNFINKNDKGIEVGAGAGFSKYFISNKNFKITDLANYAHLDYKNVDAQKTKFSSNSFNFIIAVNIIHHVPFPIKFFYEMNRILKKGGKLIIQEANCSIIFQLITILMKHEGFDFTKNVWSKKIPLSKTDDIWAGNIAVPHLVFDNLKEFNKNLGHIFRIKHQKFYECFIFLNSGGVSSKTIYIPLNNFFLKLFNFVDNVLTRLFPNIFAMGRQIVLEKL